MSLILLVDDLPDLVELYTDILETLGHEVISAQDGVEGLRLARQYQPDLVVTDWHVPRMDGCELTRKLREDPSLRDVPVLMQSADPDPHAPGVNVFLPKPCDLEPLEDAIDSLLMLGEARRAARYQEGAGAWVAPEFTSAVG